MDDLGYCTATFLFCVQMRPKEEFDHPESCSLHGLPFRSLRLEGVVSSSKGW